jgi:adenylate cyclase
MVDNHLGDGVLAVFGAPLSLAHHSQKATEAALDLAREVETLSAEFQRDGRWAAIIAKSEGASGLERLGIRVGLRSGRVVVGNLGNEQRTDYAVIGDVVNTAARLEALNKTLGTRILLSDVVRNELVDPALIDRLKPLSAHEVKGREQRVGVFTVG